MAAQNVSRFFNTINLSWRNLALVGAVGIGVGVLTLLVSLMIQATVIEPLLCQSVDSFNSCANGGTTSIVISTIIANILGLIALVRLNVYRPLLVVIVAIITLFGIHIWTGAMSWYEATAWYGLMYGLAYMLYTWLARTLSFAITLIVLVLIVVAFRFFLASL